MESVFNLISKMPKEMLIQFKFNLRFVHMSTFMLLTKLICHQNQKNFSKWSYAFRQSYTWHDRINFTSPFNKKWLQKFQNYLARFPGRTWTAHLGYWIRYRSVGCKVTSQTFIIFLTSSIFSWICRRDHPLGILGSTSLERQGSKFSWWSCAYSQRCGSQVQRSRFQRMVDSNPRKFFFSKY